MTRHEVEKWFLDYIDELDPGNDNVKLYKEFFATLSFKDLQNLGRRLVNKEITLPYYAANMVNRDIPVDTALKVLDKLGVNVFQRVEVTDSVTGVRYKSAVKYLILTLHVRRQSQHSLKGKSTATDSVHIDYLTGQASGVSDTTHLSLPEIMNLESAGLHKGIQEMVNVRGGNQKGFNEAKQRIYQTGGYSLDSILELGYRPTSTETFHAYLLGMHYDNNY